MISAAAKSSQGRAEGRMSKKLLAAVVLGSLAFAGSALARDRAFDFGQVWGEAIQQHERNDAIRAPTSDVMRQRPAHVYEPGSHDPSGRIILEGAR
jgi:hypothetical protein